MAKINENSNKKNNLKKIASREARFTTEKKFNNILELMFKTSIFVLFGILVSKLFSYLYKIIIARYLGANLYGLYSLSIAIIVFFAAISGLGLSEGALRYISLYRGKNEPSKTRYVFSVCYKLLLISTIIVALITFFLADFISLTIFKNENLIIFIKIFSILIPIWVFSIFFMNIMIAHEKVKQQTALEKILQSSTKLFFLIFFIFLGLKTNAVIFSFFLGVFVFFLSTFLYCRYKLSDVFLKSEIRKQEKKEILKGIFSYSIPLMFFWLISSIFYYLDSIMIGFFKTAFEVGLYNTAVPIAVLLAITPELFIQLFFPIITKEYARKNISLIKKLSVQIGKWIFIINLPVFFLMIFFPGAIINLLFGADYLEATNALRFLLIGNLFSSLFIISDKLLSMAGKTKTLLMDLSISVIANFILNIILVPRPYIFGIDNLNGISGAAIATTISLILFNLLLLFHAKYHTSIVPLGKEFFRIFFISLIPISILFILKSFIEITLISMILITITFFTSYVLLLFLMKGLDRSDLIIIKTFKDKFLTRVKNNANEHIKNTKKINDIFK
ncbi:MAG: flippase [Nanoarchaeota archaeon]